MDKEKVLNFIKGERLAVLSTVTPENKSESAVLEFGGTDNLEIIFDTFHKYRKYKNLQHNQNVSLVIGWDNDITVQYEGVVRELTNEEEIKMYQQMYFAKNPRAEKFAKLPEIKYFLVEPVWIRYSNLGLDPWEVFEIKF